MSSIFGFKLGSTSTSPNSSNTEDNKDKDRDKIFKEAINEENSKEENIKDVKGEEEIKDKQIINLEEDDDDFKSSIIKDVTDQIINLKLDLRLDKESQIIKFDNQLNKLTDNYQKHFKQFDKLLGLKLKGIEKRLLMLEKRIMNNKQSNESIRTVSSASNQSSVISSPLSHPDLQTEVQNIHDKIQNVKNDINSYQLKESSNSNLISTIDKLTNKLDNLNKNIDNNDKFESKYNDLQKNYENQIKELKLLMENNQSILENKLQILESKILIPNHNPSSSSITRPSTSESENKTIVGEIEIEEKLKVFKESILKDVNDINYYFAENLNSYLYQQLDDSIKLIINKNEPTINDDNQLLNHNPDYITHDDESSLGTVKNNNNLNNNSVTPPEKWISDFKNKNNKEFKPTKLSFDRKPPNIPINFSMTKTTNNENSNFLNNLEELIQIIFRKYKIRQDQLINQKFNEFKTNVNQINDTLNKQDKSLNGIKQWQNRIINNKIKHHSQDFSGAGINFDFVDLKKPTKLSNDGGNEIMNENKSSTGSSPVADRIQQLELGIKSDFLPKSRQVSIDSDKSDIPDDFDLIKKVPSEVINPDLVLIKKKEDVIKEEKEEEVIQPNLKQINPESNFSPLEDSNTNFSPLENPQVTPENQNPIQFTPSSPIKEPRQITPDDKINFEEKYNTLQKELDEMRKQISILTASSKDQTSLFEHPSFNRYTAYNNKIQKKLAEKEIEGKLKEKEDHILKMVHNNNKYLIEESVKAHVEAYKEKSDMKNKQIDELKLKLDTLIVYTNKLYKRDKARERLKTEEQLTSNENANDDFLDHRDKFSNIVSSSLKTPINNDNEMLTTISDTSFNKHPEPQTKLVEAVEIKPKNDNTFKVTNVSSTSPKIIRSDSIFKPKKPKFGIKRQSSTEDLHSLKEPVILSATQKDHEVYSNKNSTRSSITNKTLSFSNNFRGKNT